MEQDKMGTEIKSNYEFTKLTSKYHFDPFGNDNRWDTAVGLGRFTGNWEDELAPLIERAQPKTWRNRKFSSNPQYQSSPMIEQEEYDMIQAGMDPEHVMFRAIEYKDYGPKLKKMVDLFGLKNYKSNLHIQFPGEMLTVHIDKLNYLEDVEEKDVIRIMISLRDWVPGHFYQYGNYTYKQWRAGDIHTFAWKHVPHCTANASYHPRPILNMFGGMTDQTREFLQYLKEQDAVEV
jgi:hypothetical protein